MRRVLFVAVVVLQGCGALLGTLEAPPGYPAIFDAATNVVVLGGLDEARDALIRHGFPIEDFDTEGGFVRTGIYDAPMRGSYPTQVRVTAATLADTIVFRGEWTMHTLDRWYRVDGETKRGRHALIKLIEVALAVDNASVEVRSDSRDHGSGTKPETAGERRRSR